MPPRQHRPQVPPTQPPEPKAPTPWWANALAALIVLTVAVLCIALMAKGLRWGFGG